MSESHPACMAGRKRYQQSVQLQRLCPATRNLQDRDRHEPEKKNQFNEYNECIDCIQLECPNQIP